MTGPDMRARTWSGVGTLVVSVLFLWLATAIASASLWPIYESPRFVVMVAVTTIAATLVAVIGNIFRLAAHWVALAGVALFFVLGVPLAVPDRALFGLLPTPEGIEQLVLGSVLGWKQLLTITLPVGDFQALLVPAFLTVLVTVLVSASIALRSRHPQFAVTGPVALLIVGILFGETVEAFPVALVLTLVGVLLLWVVWSTAVLSARNASGWAFESRPRATSRSRMTARATARATVAVLIAGVGAAGAAAVAPPASPRVVLRSVVEQPFDARELGSPLSGLRRYHQGTRAQQTMLTMTGLPADARVRLATLDTYDGIIFSVGSDRVSEDSGSFSLVPLGVDQSAVGGERMSVDVHVEAYSGVWVPTVGAVSSIEFAGGSSDGGGGYFYNTVTGTAVVASPLISGDDYLMRAVLPSAPSAADLSEATPGTAVVPTPEDVPPELVARLAEYVAGVDEPGARLTAAIAGLRSDGYISHGVSADEPLSRSGHSSDRIRELFTETRMIGDEEQYSVAAALMADELDFPARVVFGFLPRLQQGSTTVIRGSDISAWIEVNTAEYGWVTIDPTPPVRTIPQEEQQEPSQVARPPAPIQPPIIDSPPPDSQIVPAPSDEVTETVDPLIAILVTVGRITGIVALALGVLLAPFLTILAAKARRRSLRKRITQPKDRIAAGWREFEDDALDHGFAPGVSATRRETAIEIGGAAPLMLAATADRSTYAPAEPDDADADRFWATVDELRHALDSGLTRRQRLRARLSLRSLDPSADRPTRRARRGRQ